MKQRRGMQPLRTFALTLFAVLIVASSVQAQDSLYIRTNYDKFEYMVPMRDGVKLFTSVYVPKDHSKTYPILLKRTPYSVAPYGPDAYVTHPGNQRSRYFHEGYIIVYQDVRGRYMSEGEFVDVRPYIADKHGNNDIDESSDAYDTVDWLVKNIPNNNGRVGVSGVSYPGFYTSMSAIGAHPAVKAVSPQAPVSKWFDRDDFFHNGAFLLPHAFDFYSWFGWPRPEPKSEPDTALQKGTPDEYKFFLEMGPVANADAKYLKGRVAFWSELTSHGVWDDFWAKRNVLQHLKNIKPAVMVVGGWYDMENLFGALHVYETIEKNNPGAYNMLVMGPWSHGQWEYDPKGDNLGAIQFGTNTSEFYTEKLEAPFFNHFLKEEGNPDLPEAAVFLTGSNEWKFLDRWPPKDLKPMSFFFHPSGKLAFDPPPPGDVRYDEYISDPDKPVPYTDEITGWYNPAFPVEDQRFADRRPDVLVYVSDVLSEDLTVAGPMTPRLFVSTTGTDCDFIVKVIDVFPDNTPDPKPNPRRVRMGGYERMVRADVIRGKFRNSLSQPEPFEPGKITEVKYELMDVFHTFKKGHRIMVQVQSTWFPMIDRNPQKFVDIFKATENDFRKATQRVYHTPIYPSRIEVNVTGN